MPVSVDFHEAGTLWELIWIAGFMTGQSSERKRLRWFFYICPLISGGISLFSAFRLKAVSAACSRQTANKNHQIDTMTSRSLFPASPTDRDSL